MYRLLWESVERHKLTKLSLFTNKDNMASRRLYESFGFEKIGFFGIFFGGREDEENL